MFKKSILDQESICQNELIIMLTDIYINVILNDSTLTAKQTHAFLSVFLFVSDLQLMEC